MSDLLTNVSNELAAAAATAGQGVVRVEGEARVVAALSVPILRSLP